MVTNHSNNLSKRIEAKVANGDGKNAFRLLPPEDSLASDNEETYGILSNYASSVRRSDITVCRLVKG